MINQGRYTIARRDAVTGRTEVATTEPSAHKHGFAGALLGATSFGAFFPAALGVFLGAVSGADTLVLVASGALFGVVSGGSIGYAVGHHGR